MVATMPPPLFDTMCLSFGAGLWDDDISLRRDFDRTWQTWMDKLFPDLEHFAAHHAWFWERVWDITPNVRPEPTIAIWGRGGAKSSSAEIATAALGAMGRRKYALYVSGTQEQADKHLDAIGAILESATIERAYPGMANRAVNKYGSSRGWRRNRLTTASGFVVDAVGLQTGTRGVKFESQRPDLMILDDVDELTDTPEATEKKIHTLTHTLLPAGSSDLAVIAIQNVIIPDGIFARLSPDAEEPATFLADRQVSGPIPAVWNLTYQQDERGRVTITGGEPSWLGQSKELAQQQINDWGIDAFLGEAQHQPRLRGEKVFDRAWWTGKNRYTTDDLVRPLNPSWGEYRMVDWDTAETLGTTSAYSAAIVSEVRRQGDGKFKLYVREVWRDRLLFPQLMDAVYELAHRWNADARLHDVWVELKSSGVQVFQQAQSDGKLRANGIDIRGSQPHQSKELRAHGASPRCREGRVLLPEDAPWVDSFLSELTTFPQSPQADRVDAFSQQINRLSQLIAPPL